MKKFLLIFILPLLSAACSHSIRLPINNFATPITGNGAFEGQISAVYENSSFVSFIKNPYSQNPENHADYGDKTLVNAIEDSLILPNIGYSLQISPIKAVDIYNDSGVWGAKWQFHGHETPRGWTTAILAGYGRYIDETQRHLNDNFAISKHDIGQIQYGVSSGYRWDWIVLYTSIVKNDYIVDTNLENKHGFWSFKNKGSHFNASIGVSTIKRGLEAGIEVTGQYADWKDSHGLDHSIGAKLGYRWQ